jgi:hypothetical protein
VQHVIVTAPADAATAAAWNDCLDAASYATHYTAPEFLEESYFAGRRPFAVLAVDGNVINGVVTGHFSGRDMICGAAESPHVCVRRGANVDEVARELAAGLRAHGSASAEFISAHSWIELPGFRTAGFRLRKFEVPMCTILLDLSKGKDWLFRQCSETRRNKIRRAIKAGVEVTRLDVDRDFDDYYDLYRDWCAFKHVPCQPYDTALRVSGNTGNRLVLIARHDGRLVGGSSFRFRRPGVVEYAANVSRREETRVRQNDLLLWRGIEWAADQGDFTYFSTAGAHFFLQKFGGEAHTTYRYSLDRTLLRRRDAIAGLRTGAMRVYQRLPEGVRRTAKSLIRRGGDED